MDEYWALQLKMKGQAPRPRMFLLDGNHVGRAPDHKAPALLLYNLGGSDTGHILISNGGDRLAIKFPWM